jgi:hypothetical protein
MSKIKLLAITVELTGIAATGIGLGVEMAYHADFGFAILTAGSCLIAIGGVIWGKFMRGGN